MLTILGGGKYGLIWRIALAAIACGLPAAGRACDTPVYRYALYHWTAAPYHVVYFKQGTPPASDGQIARLVAKFGEGETAANVVLDTFDPAHDKIEELPEPVQAAWKARKDAAPAYVVLTPQGVELFAGRLESSLLRGMTDSPVRQKLCRQLDGGKAVVFLFVPGKDLAENRRAKKAVEDLIAQPNVAAGANGAAAMVAQPGVAAGANGAPAGANGAATEANGAATVCPGGGGSVSPGGGGSVSPGGGGSVSPGSGGSVSPGGHAGKQDSAQESIAQTPPVKLALVEVSRSDPAEAWLIRAMMTIEPDLAGLVDQPMVFAVYGRARMLEPYVGKGITVENLTQLVQFVAGACSCQVKDSNPGLDLLTTWNWNATAQRLAAEEANSPLDPASGGYAEIDANQETGATAGLSSSAQITAGQASSGTLLPRPSSLNPHPSSLIPHPSSLNPHPSSLNPHPSSLIPRPSPGSTTRVSPGTHEPAPFADRLAGRLGLGLLLAAVAVLAAGLVLVRHRGPM